MTDFKLWHGELSFENVVLNKKHRSAVKLDITYLETIRPPDKLMGDTFDSCIDKMKKKMERRKRIMFSAKQLAAHIIDTIEDQEGWNKKEQDGY